MESDQGGSRSSSPEAIYGPARVILIERCSAMQVGRDNQQSSVYRITLPRAAFRSSQALAETLLSRDSPWSRDTFSHDAQPHLRDVAGRGYRSSFSDIIEDPCGDTLIIVRDSRSVQIGDRNVQHNEFRIRVSDTAVHADSVGMTRERQRWISRLREDPGDRTAARRLAEDLERAARTELMADLTGQVRELVAKPGISRWSGKFRGQVGRQIGGPGNRARVQIRVDRESKFDTRALERHLREIAARLPRPLTRGPRLQQSGRDVTRVGDVGHRSSRPGRGFR